MVGHKDAWGVHDARRHLSAAHEMYTPVDYLDRRRTGVDNAAPRQLRRHSWSGREDIGGARLAIVRLMCCFVESSLVHDGNEVPGSECCVQSALVRRRGDPWDRADFVGRAERHHRETEGEGAAAEVGTNAVVVKSTDDHGTKVDKAVVVAVAAVAYILCVAFWARDLFLPSLRSCQALCSINSARSPFMRAPLLFLAKAVSPTPRFGS